MSNDYDTHVPPRTLAGATILQIVPALREDPIARTAVNVAYALLQSGARALVAADDGPLVGRAQGFRRRMGAAGERQHQPVRPSQERAPARATDRGRAHRHRACAEHRRRLERQLGSIADRGLAGHHVARCAGGVGPARPLGRRARARRSGDHAIELRGGADHGTLPPSARAAHRHPAQHRHLRFQIQPRSRRSGSTRLRKVWRVPRDMRILLVPGRVAPWNGQLILPDVARALLDAQVRGFVFVLAGETRRFRKYARFVADAGAGQRACEAQIRFTGHCRDMPAALAAADTVVVPAIEPPVLGRVVAEAQAIGRPVVTSEIGVLPEHVVTPPEMPEDVRTGWLAKPGDAQGFAHAIAAAFSLEDSAYQAMVARARQFAEYMFSPASVATATRAVYTSLLARDT